jgi:catechol 2,3-dioxygenase-like lactoylglutathione lyase family enzyme
MITGAHFLIYSPDPERDRAFFRDVLELRSVDAGGGWLIFALPPAELGVHPSDGEFVQRHADFDLLGAVLYLTSADIHATVRTLHDRQVRCTPVSKAEWGLFTIVELPSGGRIGLYQPSHPTAFDSPSAR